MAQTNHHPPAASISPTWQIGICLLSILWLLAGSIAHDPWKPDDVIHLGIAFDMSRGHWLIPRIAGDPWLTTPPLYHWLAAFCGKLFGGILPWHDAARLASPLTGLAFLCALAATARRLAGNDTAWIAPVLAIGTLGFLTPLHDANPAIIGITGYALALLGLALWRDKPLHGGLLLGLGVGVGFLGTGIDTAIVALSVVPGVLLHPAWRVRGSLKAALLACLVALALALPWPWLLYRQSPALFSLWWSAEITSITPASHPVKAQIETLLWAAWPLLPLALWQLWLERRRLWQPQTWLPLWASSLSLGIFFLVSDARPEGLLLTLAPLSLLAASGSHRLRRGAANAFDWFGRMTFSLVIAIVWLGTYAMLTGAPERIAKNFFKATPGFVAQIPLSALALGGLLTVFWLALLFYMPRSLWRATLRWGVGLTTLWTLLALLWLPWIDYGKTYRGVSADFSRMLGNHPGCIVRQELGLAERAAFEYFSDIRTVGDDDTKTCRYLIQQTTQKAPKSLRGWRLLLETSRPGDKRESLRLYRRE